MRTANEVLIRLANRRLYNDNAGYDKLWNIKQRFLVKVEIMNGSHLQYTVNQVCLKHNEMT